MTGQDTPTSRPALSFAGFPSAAEDFQEERLDLNRLVTRHPQATFFMRASGNALAEAGIRSGDILVVDRALKITDNCLVVAAAHGELIVRRVNRGSGRLRLLPADERLSPLESNQGEPVTIWGVVTHVLHDLRAPGRP